MARQFQGAAKGRGFNPVPISNANIIRMQEENERILRGMRERRESERNNEKRQLEAMLADAAYYEKVRDRDFKIADTNLENERRQLEYNEAARVAQYNADTQAMSDIFDSIVTFSKTAAAAKKRAEEEKEKKAVEEAERLRERNGPLSSTDIAFRTALDAEAEAQEMVRGSVQKAKELGAPEYEVQKALGLTYKQSVAYVAYDAKLQTQATWPVFRAEWFRENAPDALASPEQTRALLSKAWTAFKEKQGWTGYSTELLGTAIDAKAASDQTFVSGITSRATQRITDENITALTNAAIADWNNQAVPAFHGVATAKNYAEAHSWVKTQATAMDQNGKYMVSDPQWMNMSVRGDGQPYYVPPGTTVTVQTPDGVKTFTQGTHQGRGLEVLNAREVKRREWASGVATNERLKYQEESKAWLRHILKHPEDIPAAVKSFEDNTQGQPEWLRKLTNAGNSSQGSYNSNLISTAKDFQARGMLYQGIIDKVNERDPVIANQLQAAYEKQDPFMRDDMYKKNFDSIEKLPLKMDNFGNYPTPSAAANKATDFLQDAYKQLVERAVADGAEIKDAAYTSLTAIENGFSNPNSVFYRVYNPNKMQYEFPKLYTKTPQEIAEDIDQADTQFLKNLDAGHNKTNLKKAMYAQPEIVLTSDQYDQQIVDMQSPGFAFHPRIDMLVKTGAVNSHMEGLALVGAAQGKPPIVPPPSLQVVSEYTPGANRLLSLYGSRSSNIEARAHGAGLQAQAPGAGLALVPENLREFYQASATRHGISSAENAAMGEIESAHGTYRESHTGTSYGVMQINKYAHSDFFAQHNGNPSDEANIEYGTRYYAEKKREFNGDAIAAAMAYNAGSTHYKAWLAGEKPAWVTDPKQTPAEREDSEKEWERIVNEMTNHGEKFAKAYYKYSGDASLLQNPLLLRN